MELVDLRKDWAISLKPKYVEAFKKGTKKYEIRTKKPNELRPQDRLFVIQSGSRGKVVLCLEVDRILQLSPETAWRRYNDELGITKEAFDEYTKDRKVVELLHIRSVEEMPDDMTFYDLGLTKAPLWFQQIKK